MKKLYTLIILLSLTGFGLPAQSAGNFRRQQLL